MSNISVNLVNSNKNILSSLDIRYIGYFYYVFPLHPSTFLELFYAHTLPAIEKVVFEIHFFNINLSPIINTQIESLRQFQSIISEFQSDIDSYIPSLSSNIDHLLKFNSFVTKCVKSYLCKYITSIWKHYCSSYNSIKENVKTFECIQKCVESMLSQVKGSSGSERYVKHVFSNVLDSKASNTISWINANLPSRKIHLINFYYTHLEKFLDETNSVETTTRELGNVKNDLSQFTGHITTYTNRMQWYIIFWLDRLIKIEYTISRIKNGNGIMSKYDNIKHKASYCKSSLEFEKERLQSIWKNAKMLQKHLELLIETIKKHKIIEDKLKEFREKLNTMKENKDSRIKYLTTVSSSIVINLCKIQKISNSLNCAKVRMSIGTIKQDIHNIYSGIKDINNILSVIRSHLIMLVPINLGIDCGTVNEVECCIKEIVCGIHSKYYSLSSDISTVFSESSSVPTLEQGCQLSGKLECGCTPQPSAQTCGSCQDTQGCESCLKNCEVIQQLLKTPCPDPNIQQKLNSINKVICRLIDGKTLDGCNTSQQDQQCPHSCPAGQQGQATSKCEITQGGQTTNTYQTTTSQLIKCTLEVINKCQKTLVKCEGQEDVKCTETPGNSCQTTGGTQSTTSCSPTSSTGIVSCKDLDKVKLSIDTIVNNCNCQKLKQMLNDENLKSCVDVLKWIFIYNFSELFCLYISFDKSILNEISCLRDKLEEMKFYLRGINSIHGEINCRIDCIKSEINESTKKVDSLVNIMKSGIKSSVVDMECAIDGVVINFIRCSIQSTSNYIINSISRNIDSIYNNIKY